MTLLPKPGTRIGDRTVIRTWPDHNWGEGMIVFGVRENGVDNCGAWITNIAEWEEYVGSLYERPKP